MSSEEEPVAWLRRRIENRLALARHAIELGNAAEWTELSSGVLVTGEPTETDTWHGTWPMGDSSLTRLMEANDPQDTIARCEAELAILDEHAHGKATFSGEEDGWGPHDFGCQTCARVEFGTAPDGWCRTVRLLVSGYKHWPGFPAAFAA